MDLGTIPTALVVIGALALFLVMVRRLPPTEDDVAAVVAAVVGRPVELDRPPADLEEPGRWRLDLLSRPRLTGRSDLASQDDHPRPRVSTSASRSPAPRLAPRRP
jgi:hypothetical protein